MVNDRLQVLKDYDNPINKPDLTPYTLVELFEAMVDRLPHEEAVVDGHIRLTYDRLNRRGNQLAWAIQASDFQAPSVAALANINAQSYMLKLGIMKARKIAVGLSPQTPPARLKQLIADAKAEILLSDTDNLDLATDLAAEMGLHLLTLDNCQNQPDHNLGLAYHPNDPVALVYTSGSTGRPKGIVKNNTTMLHTVGVHANTGLNASDRMFSIYHFSYGNGVEAGFKAWLLGSVMIPFDVRTHGLGKLIELIQRENITVYHSPPSLYRNFIQIVEPKDVERIRWVHLGGEPVLRRDLELFKEKFKPPTIIFNNMGSTESPSMTRNVMDHTTVLDGEVVPVGVPTQRTTVRLVDARGQQVKPGEVGELVIHSAYLASEYWNDPERTAQKFTPVPNSPERIFHTGDLLYQRPDGVFVYYGRKDTQVKIRGSRVVAAEVEAAMGRVAGVLQAAIVVAKNDNDEPSLHGYVQPELGAELTAEGVRAALNEKLPSYMVPTTITLLEAFPRTSSGKIDRQALPRPQPVRPNLEYAAKQPANDLETTLTNIWEQTLGIQGLGVDDNFFDLGGDSLQAMRLFIEIEKGLGVKLPLALLLEAGTVAQQAAILQQEGWSPDWSALVPMRTEGSRLPIFLAAPVGGNVLTYRDLVNRLPADQPCYALQSLGLGGDYRPLASIEKIAQHNIGEIKRVQPHGPYLVGGSSLGGKVAYEMAQQLADGGDEVALLVMIDTSGPNYRTNRPGIGWRGRKAINFIQNVQKHVENVWLLPWNRKFWYIYDRLGQVAKRLRQQASDRIYAWRHPLPKSIKDVERANRRAEYAYAAPKHTGRIVFFRASQQPLWIEADPTSGWGSLLGERMEIHHTPGNHTTLIYEPRVQVLAGILEQVLQEIHTSFEK